MAFVNASIIGVLVCLMTLVTVLTVYALMILPGQIIQTVRVVSTSILNVRDRVCVPVVLVTRMIIISHLPMNCCIFPDMKFFYSYGDHYSPLLHQVYVNVFLVTKVRRVNEHRVPTLVRVMVDVSTSKTQVTPPLRLILPMLPMQNTTRRTGVPLLNQEQCLEVMMGTLQGLQTHVAQMDILITMMLLKRSPMMECLA